MVWASILSCLLLLGASDMWSGIGRNVSNMCGLPWGDVNVFFDGNGKLEGAG